jgi:excisionase family DNA binding protein
MNDIDLSTWYPKSEAAAVLRISERTLERMTTAGKGPECKLRQRAGRKPEPVYNPADVDALRAAAERPHVMSALSPIGPRQPAVQEAGHQDGDIPQGLAIALGLMEGLLRMAQRPLLEAGRAPETAARAHDKLWLTIDEAAKYSGLSGAFLRRCVQQGKLPAVRDRAVKVRRVDLDNLDLVSRLSESQVAGGGM